MKGYKNHYATLKNKDHKIALAMQSDWKMDNYLNITWKPKPLFYMLISTILASICIWLDFLTNLLKWDHELSYQPLPLPLKRPSSFCGPSVFLIHVWFSNPFSIWRAAVPWVTIKVARLYILMPKHKYPKVVEALDLQAETKLNVYKFSYIEFQAPEINYILLR